MVVQSYFLQKKMVISKREPRLEVHRGHSSKYGNLENAGLFKTLIITNIDINTLQLHC